MKKAGSRLLATVMVLIMVLGMLPLVVLADDSNPVTVRYSTSEGAIKGSAWKDSDSLSRSSAHYIYAPLSENVVKAMPGYVFDYINVSYSGVSGVNDKIYAGESGRYPKLNDPWWNSIQYMDVRVVYREAPKHTVTYAYDNSGGQPAGFTFTKPADAQVSQTAIVTVADKPTTTETANGSQQGTWAFTWTAKDAEGDNVAIADDNTFVMPTRDVTITGKWSFTPNNMYDVTFELGSGHWSDPSTPNTIQVAHGDPVARPSDWPEWDDAHRFTGWYTDDTYTTEFNFSNSSITGPTTIYAGWIRRYLVKFDLGGGSIGGYPPQDQIVDDGFESKIPLWNDPDPNEWGLEGWLTPPANGGEYLGVEIDGVTYAPGQIYRVTKDVTVKVLWKSTTDDEPKTGDENNRALWIGFMFLSMTMMILLLACTRRGKVER